MLAVQVGSYMGLDDAYAAFFANNTAVNKIVAKVCMNTDQICSVMVTTKLPHRQLITYLLVVLLRCTKSSLVVNSKEALPPHPIIELLLDFFS